MAHPSERTYPGTNTSKGSEFQESEPVQIEIPDPDNLPLPKPKTPEARNDSTPVLISRSAPRWKGALVKAIERFPGSNVLQIATVDTSSGTHLPHNRCQIFRKLLEPKSKPNLPLLLTTTDIRTPKVDQMVLNPNVEVVWWIEGEKKQWRVNGNISIIPTPSHPLHRNFQSQWEAHRDIISGLDALRNDQFDWPTQRLETFKSFSVRMRASFCRPVPGSKLTEDATKWPQTVVDPSEFEGSEEETQQNQKNWDEAFGNFALVVVDPLEVDYLDMDVVPNRRWRQWVQGGMWMEEEIVP